MAALTPVRDRSPIVTLSGLSPGETRFFQYEYRDYPLPTFNYSDALEITICD